jgi:hypothetical protein
VSIGSTLIAYYLIIFFSVLASTQVDANDRLLASTWMSTLIVYHQRRPMVYVVNVLGSTQFIISVDICQH